MNFIGPARINEAVHRGLDKKTSELEGVKDTGVEDRDRKLKRLKSV
jgi:hypothetical protein